MKLKQVSRLFFGMVSLVLLLNLGLLQGVRLAQDHIESTFSRAEEAHAEVDDLVQGTELLASLVQSYTTTGRTRSITRIAMPPRIRLTATTKGENSTDLMSCALVR